MFVRVTLFSWHCTSGGPGSSFVSRSETQDKRCLSLVRLIVQQSAAKRTWTNPNREEEEEEEEELRGAWVVCRAAHNSITTSPQTIRKLQVSPQKHQGRRRRRRPLCFLAPTRRRRLNSCLPIEFVGRRLNLLCMRQSPLPSLSRRRYSTCVLLFFRFFFIRHPDCVVRRAGSGNPSSRRRSIRQCGNMYNACTQFVCWGWAALSAALRNKFKRLHALVKAVLMMFSRKKKKKSTGLDVAPIIDSSVGDEWRRGRRNSRYCSKRKLTSPGTVVTTIVNDNKTSTTCYAPQTLPWRRFSFLVATFPIIRRHDFFFLSHLFLLRTERERIAVLAK